MATWLDVIVIHVIVAHDTFIIDHEKGVHGIVDSIVSVHPV